MSKRYLKGTIPMVMADFGEEKGKRIVDRMHQHLDRLIKENSDDPKALLSHSVGQIYPLIAFQLAMEEEGISREDATKWLYDSMMKMCAQIVRPIRKLMKLGLWRMVPTMFNKVTGKVYGPDAGFESRTLIATREHSRFDMTVCPYHEKFKKYGYPELCRICCASDDATYGDLHPNLVWHRTKTLGRGGDCCDFEMSIKPRDQR